MRVAKTLLRCEKVETAEIDGILEHINEELVKFSDKRLESNRLLKWVCFALRMEMDNIWSMRSLQWLKLIHFE